MTSTHTARLAVALPLVGLLPVASAQTLAFRFDFLSTDLTPVVEVRVGERVLAALSFELSPLAGTLPVDRPDHAFGALGAVGSNEPFAIEAAGLSFVESAASPGEAVLVPGPSLGAPLDIGFADAGDVVGGGVALSGWALLGAPLIVWDAGAALGPVVLGAWELTVTGPGAASIRMNDIPSFDFGLFAGTVTPFGIVIDGLNGTAFSEVDLATTSAVGTLRVVPAPAALTLAASVGAVAARRRR